MYSIKKLKILAAVIISLNLLLSYNAPLAVDGAPKNIPPELFAVSLRQLLQQGNYKDFLNAELTNKAIFQAAINSDPVLSGTLQGIRNLKKPTQDLFQWIRTYKGSSSAVPDVDNIIAAAVSSAQAASGNSEAQYREILDNLSYLIFDSLKKAISPSFISTPQGEMNKMHMFSALGRILPKEYLAKFDELLFHILQTKQVNDNQYNYVADAIYGLGENLAIPPHQVVERMDLFKKQVTEAYPEIHPITYQAANSTLKTTLKKLLERPGLDSDTRRYLERQITW